MPLPFVDKKSHAPRHRVAVRKNPEGRGYFVTLYRESGPDEWQVVEEWKAVTLRNANIKYKQVKKSWKIV